MRAEPSPSIAPLGSGGRSAGRSGVAGCCEADDPPGSAAGARHAVEARAGDADLLLRSGLQETAGHFDPGLDGDEPEPEAPRCRTGLAALVRGVGIDGVDVGEAAPFLGEALVRRGREGQREGAVRLESGAAGRHGLGLRASAPAAPPEPPRKLRRARHPPAHGSRGDRQSEVVAGLARQARRPIEAERFLRIIELDLECRALVLLDAHRGVGSAERGGHAPRAEGAARRDRELPRGRAEGVGRDGPCCNRLVVLVEEGDGQRSVRVCGEAPGDGVPAVGEGLPQNRLHRPIDAAIGEEERRGGLGRARARRPVGRFEIQGKVASLPRIEETPAAVRLTGERELDPAVGIRRARGGPLDSLRAPLPEQQLDRGAFDGPPAFPREDADVVGTALAVRALGSSRRALRNREDQIGDDEARGADREVLAAEASGRGDHVEALRLHGRDDVGLVLTVVGRRRQGDRPFGDGLVVRDHLLDVLAPREKAIHVPDRLEAARQVQRIGAEVQPADVPVVYQDRAPSGAVALHGVDVVARRLDARHDGAAALSADRVGVGAPARLGGRARPHESISLRAALE